MIVGPIEYRPIPGIFLLLLFTLLLPKSDFHTPNIFLLFLLRFSSPLQAKYFPSPNMFLLFLLCFVFSSAGQMFSFFKYFPPFASPFFFSAGKIFSFSVFLFLCWPNVFLLPIFSSSIFPSQFFSSSTNQIFCPFSSPFPSLWLGVVFDQVYLSFF